MPWGRFPVDGQELITHRSSTNNPPWSFSTEDFRPIFWIFAWWEVMLMKRRRVNVILLTASVERKKSSFSTRVSGFLNYGWSHVRRGRSHTSCILPSPFNKNLCAWVWWGLAAIRISSCSFSFPFLSHRSYFHGSKHCLQGQGQLVMRVDSFIYIFLLSSTVGRPAQNLSLSLTSSFSLHFQVLVWGKWTLSSPSMANPYFYLFASFPVICCWFECKT